MNFQILFHKELRGLFSTYVAYALIAVFIMLMGYTFTSILFYQRSITLIHALAQAATLMLLIIPVLTMRQFSEERESKALELLLTTPSREIEIVLAKFCGCVTLISVMLAVSGIFPLTLIYLGSPDIGAIFSGYLGLFLMSCALAAIGLFVASVIDNPLIAAIVTLALFLMLWMIEVLANVSSPYIQQIVEALSFDIRYSRFLSGAVYLSDCGYFLLITIASLLLSIRSLSIR